MRIAIGRYAYWKIVPALLFFGCIIALVFYPLFGGVAETGSNERRLMIGQLAALLFIPFYCAVLRSVVFRNRESIWIEDGSLVQLHRWIFKVRLEDIERVDAGEIWHGPMRLPAVVVYRHGKRPKKLATAFLEESAFEVYEKLKARLPRA